MGRIAYDPSTCAQNHMLHYGSGYPVFKGELRQDGYGLGSMLSGIARSILPVLKPLGKKIISSALHKSPLISRDDHSEVAETMRGALSPALRRQGGRSEKVIYAKRRKNDIL